MAWFVPVTCNLARVEAVFELLETWSPPPLLSCGGAQEERRRWKRPAPDMQSLGIQVPTKDTKHTSLFQGNQPTRKPFILLGYFQQNCRKIYRRPIGVGCSYPTHNVLILGLQSFWFGSQRSSNSSRKYQSAMYFPVIFISTSTHIAIKFISPIG